MKSVPLTETVDILDTISRSIWAMDVGDADALLASFAKRATVVDATGKHWHDVNGYVEHMLSLPQCGRLHQHQSSIVARSMRTWRAESVWSISEWREGQPSPTIMAMGRYRDLLIDEGPSIVLRGRIIAVTSTLPSSSA